MPTIRISQRALRYARKRSAKMAKRETIFWDRELKGFGCSVSRIGKASWLVKKRLGTGRDAKSVWHVFGDAESLGATAARNEARLLLLHISRGHDVSVKSPRPNVRISTQSLQEVFEWYDAANGRTNRYWQEVRNRFLREIIPHFGARCLISSITKQDVRALIDVKYAKTVSGARLTFAALRPFFSWCVERDLLDVSPTADLRTPKLINRARDRVLSAEEILAFWRGADQIGYPFGTIYKLLLLTAQRRDEVAKLQWAELKIDEGIWLIPAERTKNHRTHVVHLSQKAVDLLSDVPRKDSPFLFTTTLKSGVSGFSKAKKAIDAASEIILPWRIHDLRRTAATGMASLGVSPTVIEHILNHKSGVNGGLRAVYQRFDYLADRKAACDLWADRVDKLIGSVS